MTSCSHKLVAEVPEIFFDGLDQLIGKDGPWEYHLALVVGRPDPWSFGFTFGDLMLGEAWSLLHPCDCG